MNKNSIPAGEEALRKEEVSKGIFLATLSLEKYFVSIICGNYLDSMETVWRVTHFIKIL